MRLYYLKFAKKRTLRKEITNVKIDGFRYLTTIPLALVSLVTAYAAPPIEIDITGADLAAGQFLQNPLFSSIKMGPLREGASAAKAAAPTIPAVTFGYYPADLQNPLHGPTLPTVTSHNIFINPVTISPGVLGQSATGPSTVDADTFLGFLYGSDMIHILDQYTGPGTKTVGQSAFIPYGATRTTLDDADIAVLVHAAARTFGTGYSQIQHIFFSQGTDVCTSNGGNSEVCYSPDVPQTFVFCGFHGYLDFKDIGHVIFSVEPYENVSGCANLTIVSLPGLNPNGVAVDSMASVLSHETFEAFSDPDIDAWYNHFGAFGGNEIGDECAFVFSLPPVSLNGQQYQIQSEYSNVFHACSWSTGAPTP